MHVNTCNELGMKKRRFTMVELPPDLQAWIDEVADRTKYPLTPGKNRIMVEALRAYRGVIELRKGEFVPHRPDAAILAQRDANNAKYKRKR